jgi:hypothetical protein
MSSFKVKTRTLDSTPTALALGLLLAGCGGAMSHTAASSTPAAPVVGTASSAAVPPHLLIVAPRRGMHTDQSLTVRARVIGAAPSGQHAFRYVLDGRIARLGSARLTFHELAPGRHRVVVSLADDVRVRASSFFIVRAPAPVTAAESPPSTVATTPAPEAPPAPSRTTPEAPSRAPATTPSAAPPASGGIPQGNGGDGDSDNNGGPSDGDGNL